MTFNLSTFKKLLSIAGVASFLFLVPKQVQAIPNYSPTLPYVASQFIVPVAPAAQTACSHAPALASSEVYATTAGYTDVQNATNTATSSGKATVCIPAGTPTWTSTLTITDSTVTITGPVCDTSNITPPITMPGCALVITATNAASSGIILANFTSCLDSNIVTIKNATLQFATTGAGAAMINGNCNASLGYPKYKLHVSHVQLNGDPVDGTSRCSPRWFISGGIWALVDHSQFVSQNSNKQGCGNASVFGDNTTSTANIYHHPFTMGDGSCLNIEDSLLYSYAADQSNGASDNYDNCIVIRFNTIYNDEIGLHGLDSQPRGVPWYEFYGNAFIAQTGSRGNTVLSTPRSGTGILALNTVKMMSGSNVYVGFLEPAYYGGQQGGSILDTGLWASARGGGSLPYPSGTWGAPWASLGWTTLNTNTLGQGYSYRGYGNTNTFDGNQVAADHMDSATSRTVADMVTTSGNASFTSATVAFVAGDTKKFILADNFKRGRISSCTTHGTTTLDCAGETFTAGDVGRHLSFDSRNTFTGASPSTVARILTVNSGTQVVLDHAATSSTTELTIFSEPVIITVTDGTHATMSVPATASGSSKNLSIGWTDGGWPLFDMPGRGYFATSNSGNFPNSSSYTDANYEQPMPIYLFGNTWETVDSSLNFVSCTNSPSCNPPATVVHFDSTAGLLKNGREWQDPAGGVQTTTSAPFDGTLGTGFGTRANRPITCTIGTGYFSYDQGHWNLSGKTFTYNNVTFSQGVLDKCTLTNTWTDGYWTPYTYPNPIATP